MGFGGRRYRTELLRSLSYHDAFADYLGFLEPRLARARELLAPHGTLYFHIDYREAHYCKLLLDELFGREAFLNEIIWAYDYGAKPRRRWPAKHDTILAYVRTPGAHHFDADAVEREPYMAPGLVGAEKAARGKRPTDVWFHTIVPTNGAEKTGYPTQKPAGVLRRLVAASSRPGGWCLDPFAGSGTVGAVCAELGRRYVLVDSSPMAIDVMRERLGGCRHGSPHERHEPDRVKPLRRAVAGPPYAGEELVLVTDGRHQPSADGELAPHGGRHALTGRGRDVDGIERSLLGQALPAVADDADDVGVAQRRQRRARLGAELRVSLHRPHLGGEQAQQSGVIARAGADVQHPVSRRQLQQLEHPRHHDGLGDRLTAIDRERDVVIGPGAVGVRHEAVAGHGGEAASAGRAGAPVPVRSPPGSLSQPQCRPREGRRA